MPRWPSPVWTVGAVALVSSALGVGCAGFGPLGAVPHSPARCDVAATELAADGAGTAALTAPAPFAELPRAMPALIQTIYANGAVWVGYNMGTAEAGDLDLYDAGEGMVCGVAFGNGQDVKRFFEVAYASTGRHRNYDGAGVLLSEASHKRFHMGVRRYLLPVAAEESRRFAPFAVGGVAVETLSADVAVATPVGLVEEADGYGFYVGTGLEFCIGTSSQFALSLDLRMSIVNFDSRPESTGTEAEAGGSIAVVYHF